MALNKIMIIGNLTRDAEVRTAGQSQIAVFSVAVNERFKNRNGEMQDSTEFFNVEQWNPGGILQYLKKGTMVYVEGSFRTDRWTDQQGSERESVKVRAMSIQLLSRPQQTAAPQAQAPAPQQRAIPQAPAPRQAPQQRRPLYEEAAQMGSDYDQDPFA